MAQQNAPQTQTTILPGQANTHSPGNVFPGKQLPGGQNQGKVLMIALTMAVVAVILMNVYIEVVKQQNKTDSFTVYRLRLSTQPGDRLDDDSVEAMQVPATPDFETAFEGFVRRDPSTSGPDRLGDAFTRHGARGEFLTHRMFSPIDKRETEKLVRPGKVIYSVPVTRTNLVSVVRPGSEVNLQGLFRINGENRSVFVMTGVRVAAINGLSWLTEEDSDRGKRIGSFVALDLEINPQDALSLMSLTKQIVGGTYEIALRNPSDSAEFTGINPVLIDLTDHVGESR